MMVTPGSEKSRKRHDRNTQAPKIRVENKHCNVKEKKSSSKSEEKRERMILTQNYPREKKKKKRINDATLHAA